MANPSGALSSFRPGSADVLAPLRLLPRHQLEPIVRGILRPNGTVQPHPPHPPSGASHRNLTPSKLATAQLNFPTCDQIALSYLPGTTVKVCQI
ncbi:MAG: hypothetical protein ABSE49_15905, partial [Polyangiaceae bacterium]